MSALTEKQKATLCVPLEAALTLLEQALATDDKAYGRAALAELRKVQRLTADYMENPSHDA